MSTFIEARVIQKVDTEANWLSNPLKLYQGEIAFVSDKYNFKLNNTDIPKTFAELDYYYKGDILGSVAVGEEASKTAGVYRALTSGTIGGIVVKEGYYTLLRKKEDGSWVLESEVKIDLTEINNKITQIETKVNNNEKKIDDFIENFSVTTDTDFNAESNNPIANSAVTPLAQFIGDYGKQGVLVRETKTTDWKIGAFEYPNLTIFGDGTEPNLKRIKIDVTEAYHIEFSYVSGNAQNQSLLKTLIGQKADNSLVILEEMNKPGNPIVNATYNVSDYKFIYANVIYSTGYDSVIKVYKGEITKKLEEFINPLESILDSFINPLEITLDKTYKASSSTTNLYGVDMEAGILRANNTLNPYSETGATFKTWRNIPTTEIKEIDFSFVRIGLLEHANLLGIKSNGDIDVLIQGVLTTSFVLETIKVSLKKYSHFSFSVALSDVYPIYTSQVLKFYKGTPKEVTKDSVLNAIKEASQGSMTFGSATEFSLKKPQSLVKINLVGELPTDISDAREKTKMIMEFSENNKLVFRVPIENKIQGTGTATFDKKNWNCKLLNDDGASVKVKFGNWFPDSSFHLKAFVGDLTMSRDTAGARLYKSILDSRPFPQSFNAKFPLIDATNDNNISNFMDDSGFFLDGFPLELYVNGVYHGLYIWRQRRENECFRINNANKKHFYLANSNTVPYEISTGFDSQYWELKSPKISGYKENGPITDTAVLADITRLFDWLKGVSDGTIDFETTYANYINVDNWVDSIIFNQSNQNWDYYVNNLNLLSWDGLVWSLAVTDLNWTAGVSDIRYDVNKYSESVVKTLHWRGDFFPNKLYPKLLSRIKTRYTELRNNNVLDLNSIYNIYKEIPEIVGTKAYIRENDKWSTPNTENKGYQSLQYIMQFYTWKLSYLDSIWKI